MDKKREKKRKRKDGNQNWHQIPHEPRRLTRSKHDSRSQTRCNAIRGYAVLGGVFRRRAGWGGSLVAFRQTRRLPLFVTLTDRAPCISC